MTKRFNNWYDGLREPWRFLTAMGLATIGIALLASGNVLMAVFGATYLTLLLYARMKGGFNA